VVTTLLALDDEQRIRGTADSARDLERSHHEESLSDAILAGKP
jgi:hypothetical protein